MTNQQLYPDPPHLIIAIWSDQDEHTVFDTVCDVLVGAGGVPSGVVQAAPRGARFEMVSDLADVSSVLNGPLPDDVRPLKAGFVWRRNIAIVEHLLGSPDEPHPTAVSLTAGALGLPESLWRSADRKAAKRLAAWSTDLLREMSLRCRAWYGTISVETTLSTPSRLAAGESLDGELFVRAAVAEPFRRAFTPSEGVRWEHGEFHASWSPFVSGPNEVHVDLAQLKAASIELGRKLLSR